MKFWEDHAKRLFGLPDAEAVTVTDPARGIARVALMQDGRVTVPGRRTRRRGHRTAGR
ncbi:hypothetical protein [Mangrovicoccus ximenensis]|uniref:hypothetical protein n=1 Tax=Mangrovicoccus ximenensis TaxID=1911570 RepID=UPI001375345B|nr:hypothetical protein [Mangrovicoccus ximenensis]